MFVSLLLLSMLLMGSGDAHPSDALKCFFRKTICLNFSKGEMEAWELVKSAVDLTDESFITCFVKDDLKSPPMLLEMKISQWTSLIPIKLMGYFLQNECDRAVLEEDPKAKLSIKCIKQYHNSLIFESDINYSNGLTLKKINRAFIYDNQIYTISFSKLEMSPKEEKEIINFLKCKTFIKSSNVNSSLQGISTLNCLGTHQSLFQELDDWRCVLSIYEKGGPTEAGFMKKTGKILGSDELVLKMSFHHSGNMNIAELIKIEEDEVHCLDDNDEGTLIEQVKTDVDSAILYSTFMKNKNEVNMVSKLSLEKDKAFIIRYVNKSPLTKDDQIQLALEKIESFREQSSG